MYSHFWYDAPASQLATYYLKHDLPVYIYSFDHISENFYDIDSEFSLHNQSYLIPLRSFPWCR